MWYILNRGARLPTVWRILFMAKFYDIKVSLEEWQFFQRYRQLRKSYETGMVLLEWTIEGLIWRLVGSQEPNRNVKSSYNS